MVPTSVYTADELAVVKAPRIDGRKVMSASDHSTLTERSCADCGQYQVTGAMVAQTDGRIICSACHRALKAQAAAHAQPNMFVEQQRLF